MCFGSCFVQGVECTLFNFKVDYSNVLDERSRSSFSREVLTIDPYSQPRGSRERAKLWEEIALNLNAVSEPRFSVSVRSVRDRVNLVPLKNHKRRAAEESKASGIAVDETSEFDAAIKEIFEKAEAVERDQQMISEGKKPMQRKRKIKQRI